MSGSDWVSRAVEGILFAPDREAVRKELWAHLEDRRAALEAQGLTAEEAESAAAEAMGDPAEVAEELAKIHAPWWGWLWRLSQWTLALVFFIAVVSLVPAALNNIRFHRNMNDFEREVLEEWRIEGGRRVGAYWFSSPGVRLERGTVPGTGDRDQLLLVVALRESTWRFWELSDTLVLDRTAADNRGRQYQGCYYREGGFYCLYKGEGIFSVFYEIEFPLADREDVPDWLDIPLGEGSAGIRVDLERGRVS